jgi:hypothetical protein
MRLFLRNDRRPLRENNADSASQPITVRHFTGSDACHIIITPYCLVTKINEMKIKVFSSISVQ